MTYNEYRESMDRVASYVMELIGERDERQGKLEYEIGRHNETYKKLIAAQATIESMNARYEGMTRRYHDGIVHEQRARLASDKEWRDEANILRKMLDDCRKEQEELYTYRERARVWFEGHFARHPECLTDFVTTVLLVK
jgi:hypothetical protein